MKKNILLLLLIAPFFLAAQDLPKLKFSVNNFSPVIVQAPGLTAKQMYLKTLDWIQEYYKNPKEVLKASIVDKKIRVEGYLENAWSYKTLGITYSGDLTYVLEVSYKDGRYRYDYIIENLRDTDGSVFALPFRYLYKKNGALRKSYKGMVPSLEASADALLTAFNNYVTGKTTEQDSKW